DRMSGRESPLIRVAERRTLNEPPPIRQLLRGRLLEEQATVTLQGGAEGVESRPALRPHRHLNLLREHAVRLGDGLTAMNLVDVSLCVLGDVTDPRSEERRVGNACGAGPLAALGKEQG